jgi:putative flavoprotein involved in K+ transport
MRADAAPPSVLSVSGHGGGGTEMERFETVIIGGGQAGLAAGYHLARRNREFMILDALERIGDSWRTRWDSLRLFTPAKYNGLPGMRFPARRWSFPTKNEMGDYLEAYAARFELPVRTGVVVDRVYRSRDGYVVEAGDLSFGADHVIVASGAYRAPKTPGYAGDLDPRIVQLHSSEYRNSSQLAEGPVLVVGAGNSGAEIAFELSRTHPTLMAGKESGEIPVPHGGVRSRLLLPIIRFLGYRVLTRRTPIGRKVGPKLKAKAAPLIRVKSKHLAEAGVERVGRVVGVRDGMPLLEDGRVLEVANVVWCTGFRHDFSWIDLPILSEDGQPVHKRGVVASAPGLYFVGLVFQYAAASDVLPGVGRDADHVARHLAELAARPGRAVAGAHGRTAPDLV